MSQRTYDESIFITSWSFSSASASISEDRMATLSRRLRTLQAIASDPVKRASIISAGRSLRLAAAIAWVSGKLATEKSDAFPADATATLH